MALCCRGDGLLLTWCFLEGEEVSTSSTYPLRWGYTRSYVLQGTDRIVCLLSVQLNDTLLHLDWISFMPGSAIIVIITTSICGKVDEFPFAVFFFSSIVPLSYYGLNWDAHLKCCFCLFWLLIIKLVEAVQDSLYYFEFLRGGCCSFFLSQKEGAWVNINTGPCWK